MTECLGAFEILSVGNRIAILLVRYTEEILAEEGENGMGEVGIKFMHSIEVREQASLPEQTNKNLDDFPRRLLTLNFDGKG